MASALQGGPAPAASSGPLRPGDPVGVALMSGDMELGATGTVTEVDGDRVYAFGHPFYGLGPDAFPMTRAYVHTLLPSLANSSKIASTGEVIGTVLQDRATTIAGTLGPGPTLIPIKLTLTSERGTQKTFTMAMVNDQLFTPLLAYLSILNTLRSYERQNGVGSYALRGSATIKKHGTLDFEDLFTGDSAVGRRRRLGRRADQLAAAQLVRGRRARRPDARHRRQRAAAQRHLERVWIDGVTPARGHHGRP